MDEIDDAEDVEDGGCLNGAGVSIQSGRVGTVAWGLGKMISSGLAVTLSPLSRSGELDSLLEVCEEATCTEA